MPAVGGSQRRFAQRRQDALASLAAPNYADKSRKGSVDARAWHVIQAINTREDMFTTSSCSGRTSIFGEPTEASRAAGKKGGEWVFASHDPLDEAEVAMRLAEACSSGSALVFRFEPFLLHAECATHAAARALLGAALRAGFRESGIMQGTGEAARIMVGVRCSLRLEVPVADGGRMLVPDDYIRYLVRLANEKFELNTRRIQRLEGELAGLPGGAVEDAGLITHPPLPAALVPASATEDSDDREASRGLVAASEPGQDALAMAGSKTVNCHGRPAPARSVLWQLKARQEHMLQRMADLQKRLDVEAGELPAQAPAGVPTAIKPAVAEQTPLAPHYAWHPMDVSSSIEEGIQPDTLMRWGAASVVWRGRLVVLGGYGGSGTHARRADVLIGQPSLKTDGQAAPWQWSIAPAPDRPGHNGPSPRMGHSATLLGDVAVVVGGRANPAQPLADVWLLHLPSGAWAPVAPAVLGSVRTWPGRHRHSAVAVPGAPPRGASYAPLPSHVLVFGGEGLEGPRHDLWALVPPVELTELAGDSAGEVAAGLPTQGWSWVPITAAPSGSAALMAWPVPGKSHAAAVVGDCMYLHGGTASYGGHRAEMYRLPLAPVRRHIQRVTHASAAAQPPPSDPAAEPSGVIWDPVPAGGHTAPQPCISHILTPLGPRHLILTGGHPTSNHDALHVYDTESCGWERIPVQPPDLAHATCLPRSSWLPIRHCAGLVPSASSSLELVVMCGGAFCFSFGSVFSGAFTCDITPLLAHLDNLHLARPIGDEARGRWALLLPATATEPVKKALRAAGWLDVTRRCGSVSDLGRAVDGNPAEAAGIVALPVADAAAGPLRALLNSSGSSGLPAELATALAAAGSVRLGAFGTPAKPQTEGSHLQRMRAEVAALLPVGLPPDIARQLVDDLPTKREVLGNSVALVPEHCLRAPAWELVWGSAPDAKPRLLAAIARALRVDRLARHARIANTGTRDSQTELLLGEDGWVTHPEHGVKYVMDITRVMFSSGNVTERGRMGRLDAAGEVVVDMFAGIGYFTLPLLVHAGVRNVYACDWNPAALDCLARGLAANRVADRCEVRQGDCREVAPRGVADRVLLGLLPTSRPAWPVAVAALGPKGGWLHVHANVLQVQETVWVLRMIEELRQLCEATPGRARWRVYVKHVERVKWYAPRVRHIVVDVQLLPPADASTSLHVPDAAAAAAERSQAEHSTAHDGVARTVPLPWFKRPISELRRAPSLHNPTREEFEARVQACRQPLLLTGLELGPAPARWDAGYLAALPGHSATCVSVHVTRAPSGALDFVRKNFVYRTMPWPELVMRVSGGDVPGAPPPPPILQPDTAASSGPERYYLRSLGPDPRKVRRPRKRTSAGRLA